MIRRLKKQLSDLPLPALLVLLVIPFPGFFWHTLSCSPALGYPFLITLALSLGILLVFQFQIRRDQAQVALQVQDIQEKVNLCDAQLVKEQLSLEAIHQEIFNYSRLKGLTEKLGMSFSLEDASAVLADEVESLFETKQPAVILYLLHADSGELGLAFSQKGKKSVTIKAKKGDVYDEWVAKTLKPLLVEDTHSDFRFDAEKTKAEEEREVRSLMSVPLLVGNRTVGILRVDSAREEAFSTDDTRLLSIIGDLAAVSLENVQLYERVEDLAIHDSLTGLFLRRYFAQRLSQEMTRALRKKNELSLLLMDLDQFKRYNDTYGHSAGDIVLKAVAMILLYMFDRPGNMVCRYGGEEFAVLLPDCGRAKALELAEGLRKKIESQPVILRREKTHITASMGVATFPRDAQLKEDLIQKVDDALYAAKRKGRNCVVAVKEK